MHCLVAELLDNSHVYLSWEMLEHDDTIDIYTLWVAITQLVCLFSDICSHTQTHTKAHVQLHHSYSAVIWPASCVMIHQRTHISLVVLLLASFSQRKHHRYHEEYIVQ